ncbi:hypothetical protein EZS27_005626 [termite gut metagenome]|uniref:Uncharacterized protein n=1 Tax=termite gut metagenome TaxID=433724 RepID=A0A5J4SN53_9ZZZZ
MTQEEIIQSGELVYHKPTLMNDNSMHYCPAFNSSESIPFTLSA